MVRLTRLSGCEFVVNAELIETLEATPDTVVSLTDGKKFVVLDSLEEVIEKVVAYRRLVEQGSSSPADLSAEVVAS